MVVLCDTNGGSMPWEVEQIIREMKAADHIRLEFIPQ
jgi:isopropylmalate/homocitrate/citramalate synthase